MSLFPAEANWSTSEGEDLRVIEDVEVVICPSFTFTFTEYGFGRVRHCTQACCIENQIRFTQCCTAAEPGAPLPNGFARSSILTPCDSPWTPNGVVAEAETNQHTVVTGTVDLEALHKNRQDGAAPTFRDRTRRAAVMIPPGATAPSPQRRR